ncbi:MAG: response regulator [Bacteroidales bacterium]|nr:response regulator [Bacteroidales bacterium]MCF8390761.1 response regulator [Bacteroidales bacterium]
MKPINFKSIKSRLTFWFLLLSLGPLFIGILITFSQQRQFIEKRANDKLTAIRDLKTQQINNWLDERVGDIRVMAQDYEIRELENSINKVAKTANDFEKIGASRELLRRYQKSYNDYEEIFIIDAKTGLIILSTHQELEGENKTFDPYFTVPLSTGKVYIRDIYYSQALDRPQMTLSTPIYCFEHNTHILGILVARIDLDNSLYKLLQNRVGLGESGETLLVNSDVIALNELRHYENAPLSLKIEAEPAVRAASGETGIIKTMDYRNIEVLAAYTYISRTGWGFICKQDMNELNTPIRKLLKKYIILYLISIIVIVLIGLWIINIISKPIVEMNVATQKIKSGDYKARVKVSYSDELGSLANSVNEMAASIESNSNIQKAVVDISYNMIKLSSMKEFASGLLKQLIKITEANMAAFYILNESNSQFEHFNSIGSNEKLMRSFSSVNPEGEFGYVISKKEIVYLQDIPDDTQFHFKTTAGDFVPKEIITIPVLVDNAVVAVVSLVNIHKFQKEIFQIILQSWTSINSSYANLLANERTRVLAEGLSRSNQRLEAQSEELQEQAEELQEQTHELQRNAEDLQTQNLELEAQRNQVEEANRLKSEFLSNMSHELRTPLNSINALSQVLITNAKNKLDKDENSYLEIIERNGKRLLSLINNILDLSKIEAGKIDIMPQAVSIKSLLAIIRENMYSIASKNGIEINLNVEEGLPPVETDEGRLHQVLLNIISNSVKFTEKGSVTISAKQEKDNVIIEVRDTGIGISEEMLPYIFDEFRQGDGSSSRKFEGTGLGLAIAKKLITVLGGSIRVTSKLGEGSVFMISVPLKWEIGFNPKNAIILKSVQPETSQNTILVVDDDPKIVKNISEYLKKSGYNTISASNGKVALELAEQFQPFAITLDIIMPEMDGWEVLQKLKAKSETKDIPVIVICVSEEKDTGFALGAVGYLNKPLNMSSLKSEIVKLNRKPEVIMIVDDNTAELKEMASAIEAENIRTILANSGEECLKLIKDTIPDLLVLDLIMPGVDGFQVLDEIRRMTETRDIPVIVVTAKDLNESDKKKLSHKITALIAKSENTRQDLYNEITRILNGLEVAQKIIPKVEISHNSRILLVEDNPDAIVQMKSILEREKYIVDVAMGGQQAIDYIQKTIPDGIILDLMMPGVDGFEVLERIRSYEATKNIPVLILTAKDLTPKDFSRLSANNIQQLILKGDVDVEGMIFRVGMMLGDQQKIKSGSQDTKISNKLTDNTIADKKQKITKDLANLLLVEDNPDNMTTIKAILKGKYNIYEALNGEDGLLLVQSQKPDIILLDMSLPGMDGEEVVQILKANEETKNIPVIAVTAQVMKGDKERILNFGCDGFVEKPISQDKLLRTINDLLEYK